MEYLKCKAIHSNCEREVQFIQHELREELDMSLRCFVMTLIFEKREDGYLSEATGRNIQGLRLKFLK